MPENSHHCHYFPSFYDFSLILLCNFVSSFAYSSMTEILSRDMWLQAVVGVTPFQKRSLIDIYRRLLGRYVDLQLFFASFPYSWQAALWYSASDSMSRIVISSLPSYTHSILQGIWPFRLLFSTIFPCLSFLDAHLQFSLLVLVLEAAIFRSYLLPFSCCLLTAVSDWCMSYHLHSSQALWL